MSNRESHNLPDWIDQQITFTSPEQWRAFLDIQMGKDGSRLSLFDCAQKHVGHRLEDSIRVFPSSALPILQYYLHQPLQRTRLESQATNLEEVYRRKEVPGQQMRLDQMRRKMIVEHLVLKIHKEFLRNPMVRKIPEASESIEEVSTLTTDTPRSVGQWLMGLLDVTGLRRDEILRLSIAQRSRLHRKIQLILGLSEQMFSDLESFRADGDTTMDKIHISLANDVGADIASASYRNAAVNIDDPDLSRFFITIAEARATATKLLAKITATERDAIIGKPMKSSITLAFEEEDRIQSKP